MGRRLILIAVLLAAWRAGGEGADEPVHYGVNAQPYYTEDSEVGSGRYADRHNEPEPTPEPIGLNAFVVDWQPTPRIVFRAIYETKPCDEGYGHIVIELQAPMEWETVEVECGRIVPEEAGVTTPVPDWCKALDRGCDDGVSWDGEWCHCRWWRFPALHTDAESSKEEAGDG